MPYVHRTVVCGETVEHRKMYSSRVHSKEVKPRKRSSEKETSKRQERINERVAEEHLRWLINCNYHYGCTTGASKSRWNRPSGTGQRSSASCARRTPKRASA